MLHCIEFRPAAVTKRIEWINEDNQVRFYLKHGPAKEVRA
jgi:hypothetical protein